MIDLPNGVSPVVSLAMEVAASGWTSVAFWKLLPVEGERSVVLVEGDVDEAAVFERRGRLDLGDVCLGTSPRRTGRRWS